MFAVVAGLVFAIPWAAGVAGLLGGDPDARPVLWHELHALAGIGFALALIELRGRYPAWFSPSGRMAQSLAVASAVGFTAANAGEVLGQGGFFVALYGLSLMALSGALVAIGVTTRTLPRPLPVMLIVVGLALPVALALSAVPGPAGPVLAGAGLMAYGLLWSALGFMQLSRTP